MTSKFDNSGGIIAVPNKIKKTGLFYFPGVLAASSYLIISFRKLGVLAPHIFIVASWTLGVCVIAKRESASGIVR